MNISGGRVTISSGEDFHSKDHSSLISMSLPAAGVYSSPSLDPSHSRSGVTLKSIYECPWFLKITGREHIYSVNIRALEKRTGYKMSQKCGQRIYSDPPNWTGPQPPRGSEVFLSIVRDKYEYDLEPILSQFGQIYDMRLMVDFSGTNRGFAYVRYATPEIAQAAVIGLNQSNARGSVIKKASMSDDNCVLFVTGIPVHLTRDEIYEHFSRRTERLYSVSICHSANFKSPNRGFCFLEYANHSYAAQARRELLLDLYVQEWRVTLIVNWSIPDKMKNDPSCVPVKNIFVSNLPDDITFQRLMGFLSQQIETSYITHCKVFNTKAFIGFTTRDEAEYALHLIEGMKIEGKLLHASWARPMQKTRERDQTLKKFASCNARFLSSIVEENDNPLPSHISPSSSSYTGSSSGLSGNLQLGLNYATSSYTGSSSGLSSNLQLGLNYASSYTGGSDDGLDASQASYYTPNKSSGTQYQSIEGGSGPASNFAISNCNIRLNNIQLRDTADALTPSNPRYRGATPLPNLMSARSFVTIPNVNYNSSLSPRSPLTPLAFPPFNYSSWSNQAMSPNLMSATPHSPAFVYPSPHSPNVRYRSGVLPSLPSTPTTPVFGSNPGNYFQF
ncbi:hypothetical protein M8J77_024834 [Diaphorina citri]|nr:hypothetical protein M8J77_024834 [Diaphorina citri]